MNIFSLNAYISGPKIAKKAQNNLHFMHHINTDFLKQEFQVSAVLIYRVTKLTFFQCTCALVGPCLLYIYIYLFSRLYIHKYIQ